MICMSSSFSTPFLHNDRKPSVYARTLAKELGFDDPNFEEDPNKVIEFMRSLPAKNIVEKTIMFKDWDVTNPLPWKPVLDPYATNPILPLSFKTVVESGNLTTYIRLNLIAEYNGN